jgi:hypothetical protein
MTNCDARYEGISPQNVEYTFSGFYAKLPYLYLLASLKDSPGLGDVCEINRRGGEENLFDRLNSTLNVGKIQRFYPR